MYKNLKIKFIDGTEIKIEEYEYLTYDDDTFCVHFPEDHELDHIEIFKRNVLYVSKGKE